ncbi:MAG: hypothetical protein R3C14_43155 [Caldilineaceae bacterium]
MTFFSWLLFIGLLFVVGLWLRRRWEAGQPSATTDPTATKEGNSGAATSTSAGGLFSGLRKSLTTALPGLAGKQQPDQIEKLRTWMATAFVGDPTLKRWMAELNDEQLQAFAEHIAAFAHEMGFELSWLLDQKLQPSPDLERALARVISNYCNACLHAVRAQDDLEMYKALRNYLEHPDGRLQREFGQALFGQLMEQKLTSIRIADHLSLPDPKRRQQITMTIQQVAAEKPGEFNRVLKEVVVQRNGATSAETVVTVPVTEPQGKTKPAVNGVSG